VEGESPTEAACACMADGNGFAGSTNVFTLENLHRQPYMRHMWLRKGGHPSCAGALYTCEGTGGASRLVGSPSPGGFLEH
jgi:hypothetical protein